MSGAVVVEGLESFRTEVLESGLTVVVDYWARWCAPCRAIAPVIDELARELDGRVKFVKVDTDTDANQELALAYGVESIPTLHVFVDGAPDRTRVGAHPKRAVRAWVTGAGVSPGVGALEGTKPPDDGARSRHR